MTGWSEIITAAMQIIDDVRWREELSINAAQFYRAKSQTVLLALPMLSKPPELLEYLRNGMSAPEYGDFEYTSPEDTVAGETITVYTDMTGYDIACVSLRSEDGLSQSHGTLESYDATTGEVTILAETDGAREYSIDFYTDGRFPDITVAQMRLFAMAVAVVWDNRFQRDWLANTMKIKDSSFQTANESGYMKEASNRFLANKGELEDALRSYEQQCAYAATVRGGRKRTVLV